MANDSLPPIDHAEAVALFRSEIIGALCRRDLDHGELAAELRTLSQRRYRPPVEMEALSANDWLLRMRLSDRVKDKLETARALSSHALPDGSWDAVLEAALDCYIERLEKRRAAKTERPRTEVTTPVNDSQQSTPTPAPATAGDSGPTTPMLAAAGDPAPDARARRTIPAAVRRAVWMRDEGCCAVRGPDGQPALRIPLEAGA